MRVNIRNVLVHEVHQNDDRYYVHVISNNANWKMDLVTINNHTTQQVYMVSSYTEAFTKTQNC